MPLFQPPICPHCQQHLPVRWHYLVANQVQGFDPVCPLCLHCPLCLMRSSLSRSCHFSLLMLFMFALLTMPALA